MRIPDIVADHRVQRAWPRGEDHVLLELRDPADELVAGQWFADASRAAELAHHPGCAQHGHFVFQPRGTDPRLPALATLVASPGADLLSHRPGRRAVLREHDEHGHVSGFAKVVRPSRADDLAERGREVWELIGDAVEVPRLLPTSDMSRGVLRWSVVEGETLHDLGVRGWDPDAATAAWRAAGLTTARLHTADPSRIRTMHGPQDELRTMHDWLGPAVAHGLLPAGPVERRLHEVSELLGTSMAQEGLGILHRDLHDKQLLLAGDRVGMIDVDTLTVGERALDVGNVLAHLELRVRQGLLDAACADAAAFGFLDGVGADALPPERVEAYAAATRLRLAGVYAFRPRWRDVALALLTDD